MGIHSVGTSDAALVRRVQAGDTGAYADLVARYRDRLGRYALHMLGNREDAVQRLTRHLRRAVRIDPALDDRVMRAITALPAPGRATWLGEMWRWLRSPHQLTVTPLGGLAAAAAVAVVVVLIRMDSKPPAPHYEESRAFQFVLVAP